jgi:predicted transcriptional regulator
MSTDTYILMQAAIQAHLQSGGTINEVLEATKQSGLADAQDGSWVDTQGVNKILTDSQKRIRVWLDSIY